MPHMGKKSGQATFLARNHFGGAERAGVLLQDEHSRICLGTSQRLKDFENTSAPETTGRKLDTIQFQSLTGESEVGEEPINTNRTR